MLPTPAPTLAGLLSSDWVAIGIFLAGGVAVFLWWLWQRFLSNVQRLHEDLHGKDGVVSDLRLRLEGMGRNFDVYVKQEDFDVQLRDLDGHLKEMGRESEKREQVLLETLDRMERRSREDNIQIRKDVSDLHKRVDNAFQRGRAH